MTKPGNTKDQQRPAGYFTSSEVKKYCTETFLCPEEAILANGASVDEVVEKMWRYFTKRHPEIFGEISIRRGRGRGRGIETFYPGAFCEVIKVAMILRVEKMCTPMESDIYLIKNLVHNGLLAHRYRILFSLIYDRAVIDILNLEATEFTEFSRELKRILWSRGKAVKYEWNNLTLRRRIRVNPSPSGNPTQAEVNLLCMGLDGSLQDGEPKTGMRYDMTVTEEIVEDFQTRRAEANDLIKKAIAGDQDAADNLFQKGCEVIDHMPEGWIVMMSEDDDAELRAQADRTLRNRPEDLIDYVYLRLAWLVKQTEEPIIEVLRRRFLVCPECDLMEIRFRKGAKHKCRKCRGMDGDVRLRKARRRGKEDLTDEKIRRIFD